MRPEPSQEPGTRVSGHAPPCCERGVTRPPVLAWPRRSWVASGQPVSEGRSPCRHTLNSAVLQGRQSWGSNPSPPPGPAGAQPIGVSVFQKELESESVSARLCLTLWTEARQAPLSMDFSRQEYWSGLPFPSPGNLPDPGIKPRSPVLQADSLPSEPPRKPQKRDYFYLFMWLHWVLGTCHTQTLQLRKVGSSPSMRVEPEPPALEAWRLSHWTTKEVLW